MKKFILLFIASLAFSNAQAQSFEGSRIGKGIQFMPKDSSFSTQINVRFQNQYSGLYNMDSKEYNDRFLIRRFRLKLKGFLYSPKIEYKIELALSNRDQGSFYDENNGAASIVLDAVLKWHFHKNWQLWVGQTKLPGNRERVISSGALQFTTRSRLNSRYTLDRDKGLQLRHEHKVGAVVLREMMAVSTGEGRNVTAANNGAYGYTFRGEILPFGKFTSKGDYFGGDLKREASPKLAIGITYDYNVGTNRERGHLGRFLDTNSDLSTFFIDMMFKYNGFSFMSEYANKTVASGPAFGLDTGGNTRYFYTGQAYNFSTGYLFSNDIELAARFVYNEPESLSIGNPEKRYTLNLSKYIVGHTLKVQASASYLNIDNTSDELLFVGQMEIGF